MDSAGKTLPPLMVPADAPAEGLGWAFFFFFPPILSLSLSLLKRHPLSLSPITVPPNPRWLLWA